MVKFGTLNRPFFYIVFEMSISVTETRETPVGVGL
jgi:hypothetical protein